MKDTRKTHTRSRILRILFPGTTPLTRARALPLGIAASVLLLLPGCGNVWSTQQAFLPGGQPMPVINGATIFPKLTPIGGDSGFGLSAMVYFAGTEKATGPYKILVVAHGSPGVHEIFSVGQLKLHTSYGETESIPYSMLGQPLPFKKTTDPSIVQAVYECDVAWDAGDWENVGPVDFEIEATVTAHGTSRTRTVTTRLEPQVRKEHHFQTIGGELLRAAQRKQRLIEKPQETAGDPGPTRPSTR